MSADKRSVFTDATATLGQIIDDTAERDAVHIAVEPVVATEQLWPGQHVCLTPAGAAQSDGGEGVGIVDPFLEGAVQPGQRFWLFVYPRTITSLRHVWAHPEFEGVAEPVSDKMASEKWLRDFCERSDCPDYDTVLAAASGGHVDPIDEACGRKAYELQNYGDGESYLYFAGRDAHSEIPPEFWGHVEIVTGQTIPRGERASYFSCSC